MEELQKLYDVLVREGKYSKSFDEFKSKWSKDAAYKNKVYDVAVRDGLYSKTKDEFFQKYSTANLATEPVQKKKFASESSLGVGSSGSQESPKKSSGKMRSINDVSEEELKNWSSILQKSPEEKPQIDKALKATFNKINNKVGSDKRISQTLGKINSNLIGKEEEEVVSQLSKDQTLKDLGFTFEESGALGDYVTVTAPDGKTTTEISLDNFLGSKSAKQALALQKFIKDNTSKEKRIELDKIVLKEEFENKQLQDKKKKLGDIFDKQLGTKPKVEDSAYLKERLASIDTDLINETEENVVAEMEYQFGDLGFKFEKTGVLGDYMKVIAPNGKETEISLDNFLDSKSTKQADLLKGFIKTNTPAKGLFVLERTQKEEDKKFNSQKQVDESIKSFSKDLNDLNLRQKQFLAKKAQLDKQIKENGLTQELQNQGIALNEEMKTLLDEEENIKYKQRKLDAAVGKYTIMESKKGTTAGAFLNEFLLGVGDMLSGITNLATDIYVERTPTEKLLLEKDLKEETVRLSKKLGLKPPTENQSISEWKKTLTEDQIDEWEDEIDDYAKKDFKKEMLPLLRIGGKEVFGDRETTQQFADLKKEGFWGGAILGLARSLPAMAGGPGVAGAVQRTAQMYTQVSDGLAQEMENNPEFANISENEKLAITLPIGIVGAVLENVGLRNIKGSQGLINNITLRVLGKTGKGVTAKTFRELVENEVDSAITRGALTITAAGTAEFETGAAQELSNIGFKEIYNEIKGKEMFDTPDSIEDLVENVVVSGLQEGVGGFVLGVPTAVSAAYSKKGFLKMDDDSFKAFESMANDENIQTAYVTNLKNQITRGIITMSEAKTQLNDYRNAAGLYRQLPEGLNTQQKKEAMNLLKEKRDLENYVQGKDNALVVKQKERITEIDNSLTKLSETDAVQEQSTTEVPVQSETITSETLETGVPESGPEVITEQTTQEEVVEEPRIKDSQIPLKRETFEVELDNGATTNIEVTTNKDGSRQIVTKVDGFVSEGDNINKDNTLTTEEYIAKAYGEIKGEPKVEQGNDIMAPAMKEKLTPKQKAELGIEVITEQAEPQTIIEDQATEDIVKVKKSPDFMNDAEHIVTLNDEEAGRMYYDRSSKAWRDPNFDKSKYSFESFERIYGDILGETKQEATDELIRRRKESMKQEAPIEETVAEETVAEEPQGVQFSKDTILNKFLNKLNSLNPLQKNPIDNKSFIYGDKASLEFNRFDKGDKNEVSLEGISSLDKGRGLGKEAMTDITKSADELGTTLTLDAKPFGREGLGKKELIDFYKKNGFEVDQQYLEDLDFASEQEAIDYVLENESEALPMIRKPQPQVVSEQVETVPVEEVNELLELDTKDQTSLQRVLDYLDRADSALDLDPNELNDVTRVMAISTAKAVVKTLKALVKAGITLQEAIKAASEIHSVANEDILKAFEVIEQGGRQKSAPSPLKSDIYAGEGRIISIVKDIKKITISEKDALIKQIKDRAKGARESVQAWKEQSKKFAEELDELVKSGKITNKQVGVILKKFSKVNIFSEKSIDRFTDYMVKVFNDSNYKEKLTTARKTLSSLKKLAKDQTKNANLRAVASEFVKIDPSFVDNIDEYNDIANKLETAVDGSKIRKADVNFVETVNVEETISYVEKTLAEQEEKLEKEKIKEIQDLFGVDASEFSAEEIDALLESDKDISKDDDKNKIIRAAIKKAFDIYSSVIKEMISTGVDPFTEEEVDFDDKQKDIIERFMKIDPREISDTKEALRTVDSLINFIQNKSTAGMLKPIADFEGIEGGEQVKKEGLKAIGLKKYWSPKLGLFLGQNITTLPVLFEKMFKGVNRALKFEELTGIADLINNSSKAESESNKIVKNYVKDFYKRKANGESFNSAYNDIERGVIAHVFRNVIGTESRMKKVFDKRKQEVLDSIKTLSENGDQSEQEIAVFLQKAYDKLLDGSEKASDVKSKADANNVEAVEYWTNQWSNKYEALSDLALNFYNKVLGRDLNFTPDRIRKLQAKMEDVNLEDIQSQFFVNTDDVLYDKKSGSLMDKQENRSIPKDMYVDFSFDKKNSNAMNDALTDLYTAFDIRKVGSFLKSKSFRQIFPSANDAIIVDKRIKKFVRLTRKKTPFSNDDISDFLKKADKLAKFGVTAALASPTQPFKQTIPVMFSTAMNAGSVGLGATLNKDFNNWLNDLGFAISNRGVESQAEIDSLNKLVEKAADMPLDKALRFIEKTNDKALKVLLVNFDVWIARASFKAYYEQYLKKQGLYETSETVQTDSGERTVTEKGINYSKHKVNKEAANYAQRMVDRQQNISNSALAGDLFTSDSKSTKAFVKMLMPFSSFRSNQSARLGSDLSTLGYWGTSTKEDKIIALRSIAGYALESAAYRSLQIGFTLLMYSAARAIMGADDEEEDKKTVDNLIKGASQSAFIDTFSPVPLADPFMQDAMAFTAEEVQSLMEVPEKEKIVLFGSQEQSALKSLGTYGIPLQKAKDIYSLGRLAYTKKYTDKYGNKKEINQKQADKLKILIAPLFAASVLGVGSPDATSIVNKAVKMAKKRKTQVDMEELKKTNPRMYKILNRIKEKKEAK